MAEVPIRAHYSKQRWSDDQQALRRWQRGLTGYPMVDVSLDYDDDCDDGGDDADDHADDDDDHGGDDADGDADDADGGHDGLRIE